MKRLTFEFASVALFGLFLTISGCSPGIDIGDLVINVKTEVECFQYSNTGYIWIANACCLDFNENGRCDADERAGQTLCNDECSQTICGGDNKRVFYDCVRKENGCTQLDAKGVIISECGVECIDGSHCKSDERCFNNKCEKNKCGDGSCGLYEDCGSCEKDCLRENQVCCDKKSIEGDCCTDDDCESEGICESNKCQSCGNEVCDESEDCLSCPLDCLDEEAGEICCEGQTFMGGCCNDSGCDGNMTCIENICS